MKTTVVSITGVATPVRATIPAHYVRIEENSDVPTKGLIANIRQDDGTLSADMLYAPGVPIQVRRRVGVLAMPPGFVAANIPALGGVYANVRTVDGTAVDLRLIEHEDLPKGDS